MKSSVRLIRARFSADFAVETEPFLAALKQAGAKGPTLKAIATRLGTISGKIKSMGRHWRVLLDQDFAKRSTGSETSS